MSANLVLDALRQKFGEQHLQKSSDDHLKELACDLLVDLQLSVMREVSAQGVINAADLDITAPEAERLAELLETAHVEMEVSWDASV